MTLMAGLLLHQRQRHSFDTERAEQRRSFGTHWTSAMTALCVVCMRINLVEPVRAREVVSISPPRLLVVAAVPILQRVQRVRSRPPTEVSAPNSFCLRAGPSRVTQQPTER